MLNCANTVQFGWAGTLVEKVRYGPLEEADATVPSGIVTPRRVLGLEDAVVSTTGRRQNSFAVGNDTTIID